MMEKAPAGFARRMANEMKDSMDKFEKSVIEKELQNRRKSVW